MTKPPSLAGTSLKCIGLEGYESFSSWNIKSVHTRFGSLMLSGIKSDGTIGVLLKYMERFGT